jgi:hypothetical protein
VGGLDGGESRWEGEGDGWAFLDSAPGAFRTVADDSRPDLGRGLGQLTGTEFRDKQDTLIQLISVSR